MTGQNPYVGARTFKPEEGDLFFGREQEAFDLLSLVISDRLVLFYAQSGAGKSSLINTRLIPGLLGEGEFRIFPVGRLRRDELTGTTAKNVYVYNLLSSLSPQQAEDNTLEQLSLSDYLRHVDLTETDGYLYNENSEESIFVERDTKLYKYVLIIDQFEELFTTHEEKWKSRADFFDQLATAMKEFRRLWVVLVMREDYIAYLDPYIDLLPGSLRTRYYMQRLGHRAAIQAVEGPAAMRDHPFAEGVAKKLIDDLSGIKVRTPDNSGLQTQPGQFVEPVQLQVVCSSLWEKLPSHVNQITPEHLEQFVGDVDQALGNYYEERVRAIAEGDVATRNGAKERDIREWFGSKLITAGGIRNMIARERDGQSGGLDDDVVQEFVKRGDLVRAENRGGATFYELTHDRMVEPILENNAEWFANNSSLLQQQTALWVQQSRSNGMLLRGRALQKAWKEIEIQEPTEEEKAFLSASRIAERNRTIVWIATGIALLVMSILSVMAVNASKDANVQRIIAQEQWSLAQTKAVEASSNEVRAEQLAATSQANAETARKQEAIAMENRQIAEAQRSAARAQIFQTRPGGLYTSTLLAIDSWQRSPSDEAEGILRKNISLLPIPLARIGQPGAISSVEFSPDGRSFLTTSLDGKACVWRVQKSTKLFCAITPGFVNDAVFSPDGKFIVTGDWNEVDQRGHVLLLDAETGEIQNQFLYDAPVRDVNIKPDGRLLSVVRQNGKITIINLESRRESYYIETSHTLNVAAFSPNGVWVAIGSSEGVMGIWNLSNNRIFTAFKHQGEVLSLGFSPDNRLLLSGGRDGVVIITDPLTVKDKARILLEDQVEDIAFSPDGSWFVTASADKRVRVWDTAKSTETLRMLQDGLVNEVQVSPNGQWIATTGLDKTVRVWNASTGAEIFQIPLKGNGSALAFSADSRYLVSGDETGELNTWDISSIPVPVKHIRFEGFTANAQYSPSGEQIAVSEENRIWLLDTEPLSDLTARLQSSPSLTIPSTVQDVSFSPDSKILSIATERNEVVFYKIEPELSASVGISYPSPFQAMAFSPDGSRFITGSSDGKVQVWNVSNGEPVETWLSNDQGVTSIAVSPTSLAVGLQNKVIVLDINTGTRRAEIENRGDCQLMVYNLDGTLLAVGSSTGQINIWQQDGDRFSLLTSISGEPAFSMAFNPQGDRLAVGTATDVYFRVATTGEESARIPHPDTVNDVTFSYDGKILATVSSRILQFWNISNVSQIHRDDLIAEACSRLLENLSPSQWETIFSGEAYRHLCEHLPVPP